MLLSPQSEGGVDRRLAKSFESLVIKSKPSHSFASCGVALCRGDRSSNAEGEPSLAAVRSWRNEEMSLDGRWPIRLAEGAERNINSAWRWITGDHVLIVDILPPALTMCLW